MNEDDIRRMRADREKAERKLVMKIILAAVAIIIVGVLLATAIVIVPAGTVGVKDTFGVVSDTVFQPGLHLKLPWTAVHPMSTRTTKYAETEDVIVIDALSNEGLKVSMGIAVNYRAVPNATPELYKTVGLDYASIILKQPVHSVPRDIISQYDAKTLYSAGQSEDNPNRAKIEQELYDGISDGMAERGIIVERVWIRNIQLPPTVTGAIEAKLKMEQEIAQKEFEVFKEKAEADRKIAEANGIAESNRIISHSLTSEYLKWYWLQNLQNHQSTAYIQMGSDGFPIALTKEVPV